MDKQSPFHSNKSKIFGAQKSSLIRSFFATNAIASIVVLVLITIFLFKEGIGFIGQYKTSLNTFVRSGLQYVTILQDERDAYTKISRELNTIKGDWISHMKQVQGMTFRETKKQTNTPEAKKFFRGYKALGADLSEYVSEKTMAATTLRDKFITNQNLRDTQSFIIDRIESISARGYEFDDSAINEYIAKLQIAVNDNYYSQELREEIKSRVVAMEAGELPNQRDKELLISFLKVEKDRIAINPIDFESELSVITGDQDELMKINDQFVKDLRAYLEIPFSTGIPNIDEKIANFKRLNEVFIREIENYEKRLQSWSPTEDVSWIKSFFLFLTGKDWTTASDMQDWYGLLPLLTGSLLISLIALSIAIPFGVGSAIYVNQIASKREKNLVKPYIELIDAIPSVVIGFFGVVVLGEFLRLWSQQALTPPDLPVIGMLLGWVCDLLNFAASFVPFFPFQERLNAFTAGCLLALMAIPTIFTLTEDAINNVPKHFKEASLAIGASHRQTVFKVIVPTAISGIISAVMLGFGRVIGETMVVLLCAGNRIQIPDFSLGLGVVTEPVHTMTGIIAQEMGEVVKESTHYRALFMVGIVLFFLSLLINFVAQKVVQKLKSY